MKTIRRFCAPALVLLLLLTALCAPASAAAQQEISGAVDSAALTNGAAVVLRGDTVLTLNADKTVQSIRLAAGVQRAVLTVRGAASLTVRDCAVLDALTLESGTLRVQAASGTTTSALRANTVCVTGGTLAATDSGGVLSFSYGMEIDGTMTVTGGTVTAQGRLSGLYARQLLVSGGSVTGTGTGRGGEFDSCDGVFTQVLKISGGSVQGSGSESGITIEDQYAITEGVAVLRPTAGRMTLEPINLPAWGGDADPYYAHTVLDSQGAVAKSAALGLPAAGFGDVAAAQYYAVPIDWAAANGITAGTSSTAFSPDATCTRAQVVTFLWRAAGSPSPKSFANGFSDVGPSDYYYSAVLWAVEQGITKGTDATHFSPGATCTRGHVVTFLYRFEKSPAVTGSNPFGDVRASDYYYSAVLWAVARGVTNGVSPTQFAPANGCTRAQVVTFLYRDLHKTPTAVAQ